MNNKNNSWGLVPWFRHEDEIFIFAQISISAYLYSLKIDPFRGKQQEQETAWETAIREANEESKHLFNFDRLNCLKLKESDAVDKIFYLRVANMPDFGEFLELQRDNETEEIISVTTLSFNMKNKKEIHPKNIPPANQMRLIIKKFDLNNHQEDHRISFQRENDKWVAESINANLAPHGDFKAVQQPYMDQIVLNEPEYLKNYLFVKFKKYPEDFLKFKLSEYKNLAKLLDKIKTPLFELMEGFVEQNGTHKDCLEHFTKLNNEETTTTSDLEKLVDGLSVSGANSNKKENE